MVAVDSIRVMVLVKHSGEEDAVGRGRKEREWIIMACFRDSHTLAVPGQKGALNYQEKVIVRV
jgi:hypothetical protein